MCAVLTDSHLQKHKAVLVYSQLGISRSTAIVVAYLMAENKWSLQVSYRHQLRRLCLCYYVFVCLSVCLSVSRFLTQNCPRILNIFFGG